jgi:hypothetical protein
MLRKNRRLPRAEMISGNRLVWIREIRVLWPA